MKKLVVPKFPSEKDKARWWDEHMDVVEHNLIDALEKGRAQKGTAERLIREARQSKNITIRIPVADIERARLLSAKKGLGYQTYMKMLLHEALNYEQASDKQPAKRRRPA